MNTFLAYALAISWFIVYGYCAWVSIQPNYRSQDPYSPGVFILMLIIMVGALFTQDQRTLASMIMITTTWEILWVSCIYPTIDKD